MAVKINHVDESKISMKESDINRLSGEILGMAWGHRLRVLCGSIHCLKAD